MRRKNLMAALLCTVCVTASAVAGTAVFAEEPETAVTEETTEAAESEDGTEDGSEAEETEELLEHPDYEALEYVTLGEYKGLNVTLEPVQVTEDEIDSEVRLNLRLADVMEEITEGQVQDGDTANIDFEGKKDGEAFDGGTSQGYDLEIGSHSFIDGFEEGLVGVAVGETVDLPLTFPENYPSEELAGQDVVFTVTVNSISREPELTDELAAQISDGAYSDAESYRNSIKENLAATKEADQEGLINNELMIQIAGASTVNEYPEALMAYGVQGMKSFYKDYAKAYGMEYAAFLESFLGMTEEQFDAEVDLAVKQNLQQELFLNAIAETEGIAVSEEEYAAACEEYAEQYGYESAEAFVADNDEDVIRLSALQNKVIDFVRENAVITIAEETEAVSEDAAKETAAEAETGAETEAETGAETEEPATEE